MAIPDSNPRVVAVTGAAGGLGRAIALAFAAPGATLLLIDIAADALAETAALARATGASAEVHFADLADEAAIAALGATLSAGHPRIDVLVNNAGLAYGEIAHGFLGLGQAKWLRWLAVNAVAPLLVAEALRLPLAAASGLVINQSSMAGFQPGTAYGVTKATLNAMTHGMASSFAADGIRVVGIAPGLVETPANLAGLPAETFARVRGLQLTNRSGTPEDIAGLALFLASDAGRFINNETIMIDGGSRLRGWR